MPARTTHAQAFAIFILFAKAKKEGKTNKQNIYRISPSGNHTTTRTVYIIISLGNYFSSFLATGKLFVGLPCSRTTAVASVYKYIPHGLHNN